MYAEDDNEVPIVIGRVDYSVRAVDQHSSEELFNISYSSLKILDKDMKVPAVGDQPALEETLAPGSLGIKLDPYREHSIAKFDPDSGEEIWHVQFEQPPLTIFAGGEIGMSLYGVPSWPPREKFLARYVVLFQTSCKSMHLAQNLRDYNLQEQELFDSAIQQFCHITPKWHMFNFLPEAQLSSQCPSHELNFLI